MAEAADEKGNAPSAKAGSTAVVLSMTRPAVPANNATQTVTAQQVDPHNAGAASTIQAGADAENPLVSASATTQVAVSQPRRHRMKR